MGWIIFLKINKVKFDGEIEGGNFMINMVNIVYYVYNFGGYKVIKFVIFCKVLIFNFM